MAAAVMRDAAVTARGQKEHLVLKCVRAQRPPVAEDDGLSRAPVIEINLRPVFCRDRAHAFVPFILVWLLARDAEGVPRFDFNSQRPHMTILISKETLI
jgi:hypothetical protein